MLRPLSSPLKTFPVGFCNAVWRKHKSSNGITGILSNGRGCWSDWF